VSSHNRDMEPILTFLLAIIGMAEKFAEMTVYSQQLGFLRKPYRDYLLTTAFTEPANPLHLHNCLAACKKFFEYVLSLPDSIFFEFTVVQWGELVQAIVVISRLTFLMAANMAWDSNTTRANIPFAMYLDALSYRFQTLSSTQSSSDSRPKNPDVLHVFKIVLGSVKKSYERRVNNIVTIEQANVTGTGTARGYCPMMDPKMDMFFGTPDSSYGSGSSFDTDGNSTPSFSAVSTPLYHDLWATMTGSWALE
jgi:hypothetical protein